MRFNLISSIALISSCCFLYFVVASENDKYVEAGATTSSATADQVAASAPPSLDASDEILPDYKKVKKLTDGGETVPPPYPTAATPAASPSAADDYVAELPEVSASLPRTPPPEGESDDDVIALVIDEDEIGRVPQIESAAKKNEEEQPNVIKAKEVEQETDSHQKKAATIAIVGDSEQPEQSLPDITEIPTVTVTELPLEILEPIHGSLDAYIIEPSQDSKKDRENRTVDILENSNEEMQKDEQIIKINDSGGGEAASIAADVYVVESSAETTHIAAENIPNENATTTADVPPQTTSEQQNATGATVNLTAAAEEVPIPVFSEWAQKQMEAAEKQEAMEQEVVNTSAQKKNHTNGGGKAPPLKIRAKNYASPDCGAKIIASNADATNTGAVLSSSKDEYMLSPCGNRIWFVVELCEAIQAQKIDLANFELFSSSPKNFTVAVSNRFPTRDWSNVGRFIAEDKRNVQSFELHPHLFGKFVRVDIHSHYSKEHFCPVSLFRVFGTSEFEAFETENHPNDEIDDFDEEFAMEQAHVKNSEHNLFKSASDAVLSIVKKAAEVLAKPANQQNQTLITRKQVHACRTPAVGQFNCAECNPTLVERINNALSCELTQLNSLLSVPRLRNDLLQTQVCAKQYGIVTKPIGDCSANSLKLLHSPALEKDVKQSYFLNLLPAEYVGALCQLLSAELHTASYQHRNKSQHGDAEAGKEHTAAAELALNLTIDKKSRSSDFKIVENTEKNLLPPHTDFVATTKNTDLHKTEAEAPATTTERNSAESEQLQRPPEATNSPETTTHTPEIPKETAPDVNIFNVPAVTIEKPESTIESSTETNTEPNVAEHLAATTATTTATTTSTEATITIIPKSEEDAAVWDSLDNLLTSTVASVAAGSVNIAGANGANLQQKIPSGPQSESVFMRLSNRIKALERNMSLSGQYLEELSRRYKKQVEELQQTLTQQSQTVRTLEEQSRRHNELELLYAHRNAQLKDELDDLTLQVHACIVVIIFVGAFVFLVLMVGILYYRSMRRETKELLAMHAGGGSSKRRLNSSTAVSSAQQRKLNRRKSFEDFSDHQHTLSGGIGGGKNGDKQRRPSEEAMLILKECGGDAEVVTLSPAGDYAVSDNAKSCSGGTQQPRQRKISICYGSSSNLNSNSNNRSQQQQQQSGRRKGEKHSWPWQHMGQMKGTDCAVEEYDKFLDADTVSRQRLRLSNGGVQQNDSKVSNGGGGGVGKIKTKKSTQLKRQESAPAEIARLEPPPHLNVTAPQLNASNNGSDYDETLLLDEDDLDNFIPNTDLAYNEFMPDGPSSYHIANGGAAKKNAEKTSKKSRRLSSPAFFKSPFSKSLKASKSGSKEESTSWEWYRSKKSEAQQQQQQQQKQQHLHISASVGGGGFLRASPAASLDSSSLSEINFPTNSTENSFRILEEAILSSGESGGGGTNSATTKTTTTATNGNGNQSHSGSSGGSSSVSNRSSTSNSTSSSSAKKKNRSFNKIFRKVF